MSESIYYSFENDPYSSSSQSFVGNVTVNLTIDKNLKVKRDHELFLLLTTESLFEGLKCKKEHLSGDYMSSDLNNLFTLTANGNVEVDTTIDFVIP